MSGTSEKGREYRRERYYFLKAHGICTKCGCTDAVSNRTLCADCLYKRNERAAKRRNAMTAEKKSGKSIGFENTAESSCRKGYV